MISHVCPHGRPERCGDCSDGLGVVFYADFDVDGCGRVDLFAAGEFGDGALGHLEGMFDAAERERLVADFREHAIGEYDEEDESCAAGWVDEWIYELGLLVLRGEGSEVPLREHVFEHELRRRIRHKVADALAGSEERQPEACSFFVAAEDDGRPWFVDFMEASPEELRRVAVRAGEEVRSADFGRTPVLLREALVEGYSPEDLGTIPEY